MKLSFSVDRLWSSLLVVFLVLSIIGLLSITALTLDFQTEIYDIVNDPIRLHIEGEWFEEGEVREFMVVSNRFRNTRSYDVNNYTCINYTRDLYELTKELGFETKMIKGCPEGDGPCHQFLKLEVDFEPQDGVFLDYSLMYPHQKEIK